MVHTRNGGNTDASSSGPPADAPSSSGLPAAVPTPTLSGDAELPSPSQDVNMQQDPDETDAQKLERLSALLQMKRIKESIKEVEAELAGGERARSFEISSLPVQSKRPASSSPDDKRPSQRIRLATPPLYRAKSIREMEIFKIGWRAQLEAMSYFTDEQNIKCAATYLTDKALEM